MQITQTTTDNLFKVLALIEKRVDRKEAMNFSAMCREYHIGDSVRNKLKYALLEHVYDYKDRALGPSKKMYISKDKKTWKFKFRHPYGVAQWHLTDDLGDILAAMQMCPKEIANPSYYKEQPIKEVTLEKVVEIPAVVQEVKELTLEELIAQKQQELDALYHQKAVTDAKKALAVILEFAGMPVDKLIDLIKLANE